MMVGLSLGKPSRFGAGWPSWGAGPTSFLGGDLRDAISFAKEDPKAAAAAAMANMSTRYVCEDDDWLRNRIGGSK